MYIHVSTSYLRNFTLTVEFPISINMKTINDGLTVGFRYLLHIRVKNLETFRVSTFYSSLVSKNKENDTYSTHIKLYKFLLNIKKHTWWIYKNEIKEVNMESKEYPNNISILLSIRLYSSCHGSCIIRGTFANENNGSSSKQV